MHKLSEPNVGAIVISLIQWHHYPSPPLCNSITIQPEEENYDNALIDSNLVSNTMVEEKADVPKRYCTKVESY